MNAVSTKTKVRVTAYKLSGQPPTIVQFDTMEQAEAFYFELKRQNKNISYHCALFEMMEKPV